MGQPGRKYRRDGENKRNLGRGKSQSAVVTQTQSKQDVTASPKKVPSHVANTDKNYGLI